MKTLFIFIAVVFVGTMYTNCSGTGFTSLSVNPGPSLLLPSQAPASLVGANIVPVTVGCGYTNEPCVTVTVCISGTSTCTSVSNVLLDTGSYGLRLFASAVSISLPQVQSPSGGTLAECQSYADGTGQWGPVVRADVTLGNETASNIPVMIDDSSYALAPGSCGHLDSAASAGYNGILGVGLWQEDCGSDCAGFAGNQLYYSCDINGCVQSTAPLASQVVNPVSRMPADNNGLVLVMDAVPNAGSGSSSGYMYMGIGTQPNNTPAGAVTTLSADSNANFTTVVGGQAYPYAFIDSGSNGLFFPSVTGTPSCAVHQGWFCPASDTILNATQMSATGATSKVVSFLVTNADSNFASGNRVFPGLSGAMSGGFDWGLPFFFGKSVYVGFQGKNSVLGAGPYWAF